MQFQLHYDIVLCVIFGDHFESYFGLDTLFVVFYRGLYDMELLKHVSVAQ